MVTMAIAISRFMSLDHFSKLIDEHISRIRHSTKAEGTIRIYLPGEIEAERERRSRSEGVEIDPPVVEAINDLLENRGLAVRLGDGAVQA